MDPRAARAEKIRQRVIRFRVALWTVVAVTLLTVGAVALSSGEWAAFAVILPFAAIAGLVAYRTGNEHRGHSAMTGLLARRDPGGQDADHSLPR